MRKINAFAGETANEVSLIICLMSLWLLLGDLRLKRSYCCFLISSFLMFLKKVLSFRISQLRCLKAKGFYDHFLKLSFIQRLISDFNSCLRSLSDTSDNFTHLPPDTVSMIGALQP